MTAKPKFFHEPTNDTRVQRWEVRSLDVWGHAPSECCRAYDCPCIHEAEDPTDEDDIEHDDGECQCGYEVNASYGAGHIDVVAHGTRYNVGSSHQFERYHATHEAFVAALVDAGFLKSHVTLEHVNIDDVSCDGLFLTVEDIDTGKPLFNLTLEENEAP